MIKNPEFIIFCGSMFSSKTSKLLMSIERYKYQKKNIVCFKPKIDTRYDKDFIVTHGGMKSESISISSGEEILEHLQKFEKPDVIAIDEAFMISNISNVLIWLFSKLKITIIVSTLDLSHSGVPFTEPAKMFPWATKIEKCAAVCVICGEDAQYTYKKLIDENEEEIHVGGDEIYEPRCFEHHPMMYIQKE